MTIVLAIKRYLVPHLLGLAERLSPEDKRLALEVNLGMSKYMLARLIAYYIPFRANRLIVPTDVGGRLIRMLIDWASLFNVDVIIAPAHNHRFKPCDERRYTLRGYLDRDYTPSIGSYARRAKIVVNDKNMLSFFKKMGYSGERLVLIDGWINMAMGTGDSGGRVVYPLVVFTEALGNKELEEFKFIDRVAKIASTATVDPVFIKFHPREERQVKERLKKAFSDVASVEFIEEDVESTEVISASAIVVAAYSTVLLEALWLGKKIMIIDNPVYRHTLLSEYLCKDNYIVVNDATSVAELEDIIRLWIKQST